MPSPRRTSRPGGCWPATAMVRCGSRGWTFATSAAGAWRGGEPRLALRDVGGGDLRELHARRIVRALEALADLLVDRDGGRELAELLAAHAERAQRRRRGLAGGEQVAALFVERVRLLVRRVREGDRRGEQEERGERLHRLIGIPFSSSN